MNRSEAFRARHARELIENPLLWEICDEIRMQLLQLIELQPVSSDPQAISSQTQDTQNRTCDQLRALAAIRTRILSAAESAETDAEEEANAT